MCTVTMVMGTYFTWVASLEVLPCLLTYLYISLIYILGCADNIVIMVMNVSLVQLVLLP